MKPTPPPTPETLELLRRCRIAAARQFDLPELVDSNSETPIEAVPHGQMRLLADRLTVRSSIGIDDGDVIPRQEFKIHLRYTLAGKESGVSFEFFVITNKRDGQEAFSHLVDIRDILRTETEVLEHLESKEELTRIASHPGGF